MLVQGLTPGSTLQTQHPHGYTHYGIVDWNLTAFGEAQVIQNVKGQCVMITPLRQFHDNRGFTVKYVPQNVAEQQLILKRAYEKLGSRYELLTNNCEHVASYAQTGVPVSRQIAFAVLLVIGLGFLASRYSA